MAIRPIADAIARAKQPVVKPATETTILPVTELPSEVAQALAKTAFAQGPVAVAETAGPKGRPSVAEIVTKWYADCQAAAPALHHRERGEWIGEQLPLLVAALQAREA